MSKTKTTILAGPDGRLYEFPADVLAAHEVPGERVQALRARMAGAEPAAASPDAASQRLPPGHFAAPPAASAPPSGSSHSMSLPMVPGGLTLNFFFNESAPPAMEGSLEGYHMDFDDNGIPFNHTDMLWGDYIDKQGNPAVGFHSHDPVTGNAQ